MEVINTKERNNRPYVVKETCFDDVICHPPEDKSERYTWNYRKLKIVRDADGNEP